jgi:hypothetical protein
VLLAIFGEFKPYRRMIEKDNEFGLAQLLHEFRGVLMILNAAMKFVTGISDKPRGRGRPASQFATFTVELIGLWQLFTAVTDRDVPYHPVKRVPTPKSQNARGAKGKIQKIIKQPPTEFILHALRMIEPEIKDAEVFTAIKKARKLSDERYEFLAVNGPMRNVLKTIEAFAHYSENQARPSRTRPSSKSRMPPKKPRSENQSHIASFYAPFFSSFTIRQEAQCISASDFTTSSGDFADQFEPKMSCLRVPPRDLDIRLRLAVAVTLAYPDGLMTRSALPREAAERVAGRQDQ